MVSSKAVSLQYRGQRAFVKHTVRRTLYKLAIATALSLLLFMAAGEVWHHHDNTLNGHCQFCSLSHHVATSAVQEQRLPSPQPLGWLRAAQAPSFVPAFSLPQLSTRAPPSA
jgi:hypothetical protein